MYRQTALTSDMILHTYVTEIKKNGEIAITDGCDITDNDFSIIAIFDNCDDKKQAVLDWLKSNGYNNKEVLKKAENAF